MMESETNAITASYIIQTSSIRIRMESETYAMRRLNMKKPMIRIETAWWIRLITARILLTHDKRISTKTAYEMPAIIA
jgi:hypothetical protein